MISENLIQQIDKTIEEILTLNIKEKEGFDFRELLTKTILEKLKFTFLGSGLSRRVYLSEDKTLVLKVEPDQRNEQNKNEVLAYQKMKKSALKHFCPILAYAKDYSWLIMPKAIRYADESQDPEIKAKFDKIIDKLRTALETKKISYCDIFYSNVGILEGKEVIYDYGYCFKPYKEKPDRFES